MSGGGGTTTTVQQAAQLPSWLQDAAKANLARADYVSQLGYVPQYGLDVAGFSPMQEAAMQNTANAASAFGLQAPANAMAGMPQQQTNNLGFSGYSSGNLFDNALSQLQANRPAQYDAIQDMFIDTTSGEAPVMFTPYGSVSDPSASATTQSMVDYSAGSASDSGDGIQGQKGDYYDFISSAPVEWLSKNFGEPTAAKTAVAPIMSLLGGIARNRVNDYYNPAGPIGEAQTNLIPFSAGGTQADYNSVFGNAYGSNYNPSSSSGGGYTGGGSSYGANPSSTISGGSGRSDGGFGW